MKQTNVYLYIILIFCYVIHYLADNKISFNYALLTSVDIVASKNRTLMILTPKRSVNNNPTLYQYIVQKK